MVGTNWAVSLGLAVVPVIAVDITCPVKEQLIRK